ncbi:hypothetical protein F5J12DRAFT_238954 [Pisolithus orientalis]|uniref:uncharacterized protein n=1 Tax=Pisolithus orientalis TaxID=936130 RepID=UPI0022250B7B|nr:uncharacterized protein F5J12DRAFT_238954 [Pisolithus orientalis]KAI6001613.1 hypothetical protein F5J12DRAFT_238954 [Pisolithus orientalis]
MTYEESQWAVGGKLCEAIRRSYYEWGEQSEGTKVILFLSFSTETMPEEIVYRRAMATMTTAATTGAQETMSMALDAKQWPCNARMAIRWIRGTVDMNDELDGSRFRVRFGIFYLLLRYSRADRYLRRSAIAARESMTDYERKTCEHTAERVPRLPLEPRLRPSRIREHAQHARDIGIMRSELNRRTVIYDKTRLVFQRLLYERPQQPTRRDNGESVRRYVTRYNGATTNGASKLDKAKRRPTRWVLTSTDGVSRREKSLNREIAEGS